MVQGEGQQPSNRTERRTKLLSCAFPIGDKLPRSQHWPQPVDQHL